MQSNNFRQLVLDALILAEQEAAFFHSTSTLQPNGDHATATLDTKPDPSNPQKFLSSIPRWKYEANDTKTLRQRLRHIIVTAGFDFTELSIVAIEKVLRFEQRSRFHSAPTVKASSLRLFPGLPRIALWRGDITRLEVDAIVNAGNSQLLGCFQPNHICIDNIIHSRSGPRLRAECRKVMKGSTLPTGKARVTDAYLLPARNVIHTVGPIYHGKKEEENLLASCYTSTLDLCREKGLRSVAFCCISTGLFGYPGDRACRTAVESVIEWLLKHGSGDAKVDLVVFDTYSEKDYELYRKELARVRDRGGGAELLRRFQEEKITGRIEKKVQGAKRGNEECLEEKQS
ncbi:hypothetical protein AAMO2058_001619000 [Amorphochlora amoebiformis]|mmetsp:Transcript_733/g.1035  ORF Transcript_733/g.1035 Transcript_733/m.1035 type:complete len:344 (-) Transcript_733:75-1106(-)|eukprot:247038-Amorphochlora_amoeboformis.AAC.1